MTDGFPALYTPDNYECHRLHKNKPGRSLCIITKTQVVGYSDDLFEQ